jgi:DNA invertase Pin-like site-specific DNA recombinase
MKRAAIYTRVSTADQHPEMQEEELVRYIASRNWALCKTYSDKGVSGVKEKRPGLDALLDDCRHRRIDVVVVWKFDRFARSLKQLVNALDLFRQLGIGFVSCTEAIDTSLPHGEMLFQVIGAIAQWERSLIAERVRAGLQHARSKGKRLGRPPLRQFTEDERKQICILRKQKHSSIRRLAIRFQTTQFMIAKILAGVGARKLMVLGD